MESVRIDLLREWKVTEEGSAVRFKYPKPENGKGFYPYGFVRKNDCAANFVGWYGLSVELEDSGSRDDEVREAKVAAKVFFAEQKPLETEVCIAMRGGRAKAEIPFSVFPVETAKESQWEFVTEIRIVCTPSSCRVTGCIARRREGLYPEMKVKGKAGQAGEQITYTGRVYNCADEVLAVWAEQIFQGWESMIARIELAREEGVEPGNNREISAYGDTAAGRAASGCVFLEPGSWASLTVIVEVSGNMPPGGHEDTVLRVRGQGSDRACEEKLILKTLCCLPHPYLYHDREGWNRVRENIRSYEPWHPYFERFRRQADEWVVTAPAQGKPFCYETKKTEDGLMSTAYLYAITRERKYACKLADFFDRFSDPEKGYPAKLRGCSQSYVQEGHFFHHLAVAYDILLESDVLTEARKKAMERCFRIYMEILDSHVADGHISNWTVSELLGAFSCALTLQDMDRALRFVFGSGGLTEQFRHGVFNDGWWYECSVGYNTWVASMMLQTAHSLLPFGYNLLHTLFQVPWNLEVDSVWKDRTPEIKFGMYNQKWGGNQKNAVCIKDLFDATLPFLDYRGVLFGISDSDEKRLSGGVHYGATYDLAYYYYRDPAYLPVIRDGEPDIIFGDPALLREALCMGGECTAEKELYKGGECVTEQGGHRDRKCMTEEEQEVSQQEESGYSRENAYADNVGLALLRSRNPERPPRERIQAVLRYGSHGYAHGHFDITELLSLMRYGRSFFNPEHCWWGYGHFMYKFYVQCSLTKNMVVVDRKMQLPAPSRRILWQSGEELQAVGIETKARWAYPPYGGMVYEQDGERSTKEDLRRRCSRNGSYLPMAEGEGSPAYGEVNGYTEEILQRRVMAVTDDYVILFDYVEGNEEHQYDRLMQIKGFLELRGDSVEYLGHTEQMSDNLLSDAQFITDCHWYEVKGKSRARFLTAFTEAQAGGENLTCDRSNYNEPGNLYMDVYTAWPPATRQMLGRVAVYDGWAADCSGYTIPLSYTLSLDGTVQEQGAFDGWILGRGELAADVNGISEIILSMRQGVMYNEVGDPVKTPQGVFWGEIRLELADGSILDVGRWLKEGNPWAERNVSMENVDPGCGVGRDYRGGRVTIVGTEYPYAIPASPVDHEQESIIRLNLKKMGAVKLTACVGVDAFPGDERQKRKTYAAGTRGKTGRFVTVIEPYEAENMVLQAEADGPDAVTVTLRDGRRQSIKLQGIEEAAPSICFETLPA